ncbi:hypothetical protein KIM67_14730 [Flagellimonas sp. 389]|uniref:hypothetical protein n=1 Tax=Flagellimonas sp. 389 TaxID=2835862 RepID=UPI001BD45A8A|nr:hypothetical protein [Flagellimonas sp. 389]MBS9463672.1 hypothetical protein [Flagellimonas sp. 389]
MKSLVICFVAILMLVKPLWPVAEYILNYDYISNVLCENKDKPQLQCNGKCYLAVMIAKETEQNEENPFGTSQEMEIPQITFDQVDSLLKRMDNYTFITKSSFLYHNSLNGRLLVFELVQPPQTA